MTALTAAPGADGGVTLTLTGAADGPVQLSRVDANGFTAVRLPAALPSTGVRTLVDYEAALLGQVRYLALDAAGAAATTSATFDGMAGVGPQLRRVYKPEVLVDLEAVVDLAASRPLRYSEHAVIGRADRVFTTYRQGLRSGTITLRATSLPAADAIAELYADGQVACLRTPDHRGLDLLHLGLDVSPTAAELDALGQQVWTVTVTYAEVVPAALATLSAWTCADVLATYPTAASVGLAYATFTDLLANTVHT